MYLPSHFAETDIAAMHALIQQQPLATLVTLSPSGLEANHIPLHLTPADGPYGTLRGHVARANRLWREGSAGTEILAIFHGPQAYISPNWYPAKAEHGKAVPTWNYAVVHAYGELEVIDDMDFLRQQLAALTRQHEAGQPIPWQMDDAPADYIEKMLAAVVGIEIRITRLIGKSKVSQNQPLANIEGVVCGLREQAGETAMADRVERALASKKTDS